MLKKLFAIAGVATCVGIVGVTVAGAQTYDSNATSVISGVVNESTTTTVVTAVVGGFTGGGTGSSPGLFTGQQVGYTDKGVTQRGLAAGGVESRLAVWVNGAYSHFDEDQRSLDSDGDTYALATGVDWRFSERFLAGVSVGYQNSDIDTDFNLGSLDSDGWFVAPYVALQVTDNLFFDGTLGYGSTDTDSDRVSGGTGISGSYDTDQYFAVANVTAQFVRGKLSILPGVGILYSRQKSDGYTESDSTRVESNTSHLGRLRGGARLQYQINESVAPYVRGDLEYDWKHDDVTVAAGQTQPSYEDFGGVIGGGVIFRVSEKVRASLDGSAVVGRSDFTQYNLSGNLRFAF